MRCGFIKVAVWRGGMLVLALVCTLGGTLAAQWLSTPIPGTPRTSDGKPDLKAATPRTADGKPDLSGIWRAPSYRWVNNLLPDGQEAPFLPWAAELQTLCPSTSCPIRNCWSISVRTTGTCRT